MLSFHLNNGHVHVYIGPYKPSRFKNNTFIYSEFAKGFIFQGFFMCNLIDVSSHFLYSSHTFYICILHFVQRLEVFFDVRRLIIVSLLLLLLLLLLRLNSNTAMN